VVAVVAATVVVAVAVATVGANSFVLK